MTKVTQAIDARVGLIRNIFVCTLMLCKVGNRNAMDRIHVAIAYITKRVR